MSTSAAFTFSLFFSRKAKENISASVTTWPAVHMLLGFSVISIEHVYIVWTHRKFPCWCAVSFVVLQRMNLSTVLLEVLTRVGVDACALGHRLKVFIGVNIYGHWAKCMNVLRLPYFFISSRARDETVDLNVCSAVMFPRVPITCRFFLLCLSPTWLC